MKKNLLIITLLLVIGVGCAKDTTEEDTTKNEVEVVEETTTETTTESVTPDGVIQSTTFKVDEDKLAKMGWIPEPKEGYVSGDYRYGDYNFNGGYTAQAKVVTNNDNLVLVEFDELAPSDYYEPRYARLSKRYSDYGFFQAMSPRTDQSLKVLVNAFNDAENSYYAANDFNLNVDATSGASNSINIAFRPLMKRLGQETPTQKYYGYTKYYDDFAARIEFVEENGKIVDVFYDEIFYNDTNMIKNPELKKYYRQSKFYSPDYNNATGNIIKTVNSELDKQLEGNTIPTTVNVSDSELNQRINEVLTLLNEQKTAQ